jgi:hypothetical protein
LTHGKRKSLGIAHRRFIGARFFELDNVTRKPQSDERIQPTAQAVRGSGEK